MLAPAIWVILGSVTGFLVGFAFAVGYWMTHAEVGVDPFAGLPIFDDDEARQLLDEAR